MLVLPEILLVPGSRTSDFFTPESQKMTVSHNYGTEYSLKVVVTAGASMQIYDFFVLYNIFLSIKI